MRPVSEQMVTEMPRRAAATRQTEAASAMMKTAVKNRATERARQVSLFPLVLCGDSSQSTVCLRLRDPELPEEDIVPTLLRNPESFSAMCLCEEVSRFSLFTVTGQ